MTRRRLLATGGTVGAAAMVALNPTIARAASAVVADPAYLRRRSYVPLVGQDFPVGWWGSSTALRLASVSDLTGLKGRDDAFSLIFTGDDVTAETGAALAMSHPTLGRFELFVMPVDGATSPREYEAVVNRSVGAERPNAPSPGRKPRHDGGGGKPRKHRPRRKNTLGDARHRPKHLARKARRARRARKARG